MGSHGKSQKRVLLANRLRSLIHLACKFHKSAATGLLSVSLIIEQDLILCSDGIGVRGKFNSLSVLGITGTSQGELGFSVIEKLTDE